MKNLPYWKKWCLYVKSDLRGDHHKELRSNVNRANARYRLAQSFRGLDLDGISSGTRIGYEISLRLMLCYSAAESTATAIGQNVTGWHILDKALAKNARPIFTKENSDGVVLIKDAMSVLNQPGMKNRLEDFVRGDTDDVRVAATAMRHLMAHGNLTVNALDMRLKRNQRTVETIAELMLSETENRFGEWLQDREII